MVFTIAIDGPAGAGKSTVARRIAFELDFTYVDTGAMYRGIAWKALRNQVPISDSDAVTEIARDTNMSLSNSRGGAQRVEVDGVDASDEIRTPEVSAATSAISAIPAVRRVMVDLQRDIGLCATNGVVLEGRDIGTVVFPNAEMKLFLTASPEARARRRYEELQARGIESTYEQVLADQTERDTRDSARTDSPLIRAEDGIVIDTDRMSVNEVVAEALEIYRERAGRVRGVDAER